MRFLKMILPLHQRDFKDRKGTTKFNYWQLWKPKVLAFDYYVGNLIIVAFFWLPQSEAGILILRCFAKLRNLKTNVFFAAFLQFIFASILCFSFPENCFLMQIKPITDCREIRKWPYGKHSSLAGETEKWKLWRDKISSFGTPFPLILCVAENNYFFAVHPGVQIAFSLPIFSY